MKRSRVLRAAAIASVLAASLLGGCASSAVPDAVVTVQAQWLCDVTRYAYSDASGMTERLEELLAENGVSADEYAQFEKIVDRDPAARGQVAAAYAERCGAGS